MTSLNLSLFQVNKVLYVLSLLALFWAFAPCTVGKLTEFHCKKYCNASCESFQNHSIPHGNCLYSKSYCDCVLGLPKKHTAKFGLIFFITVVLPFVSLVALIGIYYYAKANCYDYNGVFRRKRSLTPMSAITMSDNPTFSTTFSQRESEVDFVIKSKS